MFFVNPNFYGYGAMMFIFLDDIHMDCNQETELECYYNTGHYYLERFGFEDTQPYLNVLVSQERVEGMETDLSLPVLFCWAAVGTKVISYFFLGAHFGSNTSENAWKLACQSLACLYSPPKVLPVSTFRNTPPTVRLDSFSATSRTSIYSCGQNKNPCG